MGVLGEAPGPGLAEAGEGNPLEQLQEAATMLEETARDWTREWFEQGRAQGRRAGPCRGRRAGHRAGADAALPAGGRKFDGPYTDIGTPDDYRRVFGAAPRDVVIPRRPIRYIDDAVPPHPLDCAGAAGRGARQSEETDGTEHAAEGDDAAGGRSARRNPGPCRGACAGGAGPRRRRGGWGRPHRTAAPRAGGYADGAVGPATVAAALRGVTDPDRLGRVGDWIVECATASDLLARVRGDGSPSSSRGRGPRS